MTDTDSDESAVNADRHLTPRQAAIVFLAAIEAQGARLWLDDDGGMCCDLSTNGHLDQYAEGVRLLRDELRQLLHERALCDAIRRSWAPPWPPSPASAVLH
jgi:hypothetical protein